MKEYFYAPQKSIQVMNKIKGSKFYGSIKRTDNKEKARHFISQIREKYYDASHNVYAYKLGSGDNAITCADDDGEPARSSGPPVLQAIEGEEITNTTIIVTRYFGGTKLGIGGLIRAYGDTARLVIKQAGRKKLILYQILKITGSYNNIGNIMGQLEAVNSVITDTEYDNQSAHIYCYIEFNKLKKLSKTLVEYTGNRVNIEKIGLRYQ